MSQSLLQAPHPALVGGHLPRQYVRKNGRAEIRDVYVDMSPYIMTVDEESGDSVVNVPGDGSAHASMSNDQSGVIDIRRLSALATSDEYLVSVNDTKKRRDLCNQPVHARTIFGKSGRELELPFPLFLDLSQTLYFTFTDKSGLANYVRPAFYGYKYYRSDALERIVRPSFPDIGLAQPYFYTTDSQVSLSALGADTVYVTAIGGADFFLNMLLCHSTGAFKFKIYDVSRSRSWTSGYIHSSLLGNAEYNRRLFEGQVLRRTSQLKIELTDLSGSANLVYLTFIGINYWV